MQTILSLVKLRPTVIRGNASEIMAIAGAAGTTKGVDSTAKSEDALEAGKALAREVNCIVAITGATDLVGLHACAVCMRLLLLCPARGMQPHSGEQKRWLGALPGHGWDLGGKG